jgi:hypothetical protein
MKKKNPNVGKIQQIIWKDHFSSNGRWMNIEDMNLRPHMNVSVGKVMHEDKESVVLASSWSQMNDLFNDPIYILKSCITVRKDVK